MGSQEKSFSLDYKEDHARTLQASYQSVLCFLSIVKLGAKVGFIDQLDAKERQPLVNPLVSTFWG